MRKKGVIHFEVLEKTNPLKRAKEKEILSYFQIFRYATCVERWATLLGVLSAVISGGGLAVNIVMLSELCTAFVERTTCHHNVSSSMPYTRTFGGGRQIPHYENDSKSYEDNMDALVEDGIAVAKGVAASIASSVALCTVAVSIINWSAMKQMTRIRKEFLKAALRQDMAWFDTDSDFNLASKMTEGMMMLREGMGEKLAVVGNLLGTAIFCLLEAFLVGWELALACGTVMPLSITASVILTNYHAKSSKCDMDIYSQAGKLVEEVLKSIKTVVAFGGEEREVERYKELMAPAESYGRRRAMFSGLGNGVNWVVTYLLFAIGFAYGTRLFLLDINKPVHQQRYVAGVIIGVILHIYSAMQSIAMCTPHFEVLAEARAAASSIFSIMNRHPSIDSLQETGIKPRRVTGGISLKDVHFSYPSRPETKVLSGFSLNINPGECVALVGPSGCGKSTVIQLIQRLYDPLTGSVELDGRNIKSINLEWLRSTLGVVGQEPVLFKGTIYENIAIGCLEANRKAVENVAKIAYAHDFIVRLPKGYDTKIGERGASLSGGQKQRIAIARSLLRDPSVLLLDEATSALDSASEIKVQHALDKASLGRTTLMVSHRLSTIVNANRIICMDHGQIVEEGTHEELLKKKGFYYKLFNRKHFEDKNLGLDEKRKQNGDGNNKGDDFALTSRNNCNRESSRHYKHLIEQDSIHEWMSMTPRESIAMSPTAFQNNDHEVEETDDEEMSSVSQLEIFKLIVQEWPYLVLGSAAAIIQGACMPFFSLLYSYIFSMYALQEDLEQVLYKTNIYSGLYVVLAAFLGISVWTQVASFSFAGIKLTSRLRLQYFSSLLKQEIGYFERESNSVGALCARLSGDAAQVQAAIGIGIGLFLQGMSALFVGFILAFTYNWKLTLFCSIFIPFKLGIIWLKSRVSQKARQLERTAMEAATAISTEALISIKTVQSLAVEKVFMKKFEDELSAACEALTSESRFNGLIFGLSIYLPQFSYLCAAIYGTTLIAYEGVSYYVITLTNSALVFGAQILGQSLVYLPNMKSAQECAARMVSVICREPKIKTKTVSDNNTKDWVATGAFNIRNIEFCYPNRPNLRILSGINLKMAAGKTIALVGHSGCGKSTIMQLLQRFYDPDSGNIELDDRDIRSSLALSTLRKQLGVVQQEPVLFDRTIAQNIAYGDNSRIVGMEDIIIAAKAANIHTFIVSLPKGYDTIIGSAGAQLSGGQKQRVCIARALVRNPRLLLLDEATSALDATSEKLVTEALEKAAKGRTCVTIAHRLSTIKDADLICVLEKGIITEKGTHNELFSSKGRYYRMCLEQGINAPEYNEHNIDEEVGDHDDKHHDEVETSAL